MGCGKIMNKKRRAAVSAGMFQSSNMTTHRSLQPTNRAGGGWGSSVACGGRDKGVNFLLFHMDSVL